MENLQVYRARFNADIATLEPNLHRTASTAWPAAELRTQPVSGTTSQSALDSRWP